MDINREAPAVFQFVPIDQISPSPHQARKDFDEESIKSLAESIQKEGLLQPVSLRKAGDAFELIAGERRLRAVKLLGWPAINAIIIDVISEAAASAKGLIENLQRKDLNPMEEAEGFAKQSQLDPTYWTHDEIARVAGRSRTYITLSIGLLKLSASVQDNVRARTLSRSHGLELMRLQSPEAQSEAAKQVLAKKLTWEATRKLVDTMLKQAKAPGDAPPPALLPKGEGGQRPGEASDFMATVWQALKAENMMFASGYWDVAFKKNKWVITMETGAMSSPDDFAIWFEEMGSAVRKNLNLSVQSTNESPVDSPIPPLSDEEEQIKAAEEDAIKLRKMGIGGFNK